MHPSNTPYITHPPSSHSPTVRVGHHLLFRTKDLLGQGSFSTVFFGHWKSIQVAVKRVKLQQLDGMRTGLLENELKILQQLEHPNVVGLLDIVYSKNHCYIVTQLCRDSTLENMIKGRPLQEEQVLSIFEQITEGCQYLNSKGIIHRDIKPSNILIDSGTYKLADFGFAILSAQQYNHALRVGTSNYMSPETYHHNRFDHKSDIWSIGVSILQCLLGKVPFSQPSACNLPRHLSKLSISDGLKQIIESCLQKEASLRPEAGELARRLKRTAQARYVQRAQQFNQQDTVLSNPIKKLACPFKKESSAIVQEPVCSHSWDLDLSHTKPQQLTFDWPGQPVCLQDSSGQTISSKEHVSYSSQEMMPLYEQTIKHNKQTHKQTLKQTHKQTHKPDSLSQKSITGFLQQYSVQKGPVKVAPQPYSYASHPITQHPVKVDTLIREPLCINCISGNTDEQPIATEVESSEYFMPVSLDSSHAISPSLPSKDKHSHIIQMDQSTQFNGEGKQYASQTHQNEVQLKQAREEVKDRQRWRGQLRREENEVQSGWNDRWAYKEIVDRQERRKLERYERIKNGTFAEYPHNKHIDNQTSDQSHIDTQPFRDHSSVSQPLQTARKQTAPSFHTPFPFPDHKSTCYPDYQDRRTPFQTQKKTTTSYKDNHPQSLPKTKDSSDIHSFRGWLQHKCKDSQQQLIYKQRPFQQERSVTECQNSKSDMNHYWSEQIIQQFKHQLKRDLQNSLQEGLKQGLKEGLKQGLKFGLEEGMKGITSQFSSTVQQHSPAITSNPAYTHLLEKYPRVQTSQPVTALQYHSSNYRSELCRHSGLHPARDAAQSSMLYLPSSLETKNQMQERPYYDCQHPFNDELLNQQRIKRECCFNHHNSCKQHSSCCQDHPFRKQFDVQPVPITRKELNGKIRRQFERKTNDRDLCVCVRAIIRELEKEDLQIEQCLNKMLIPLLKHFGSRIADQTQEFVEEANNLATEFEVCDERRIEELLGGLLKMRREIELPQRMKEKLEELMQGCKC